MFLIQVWHSFECDEELRSISVRPHVGHRKDAFVNVGEPYLLIVEEHVVNAVTPRLALLAVITALYNLIADKSVELVLPVPEHLTHFT